MPFACFHCQASHSFAESARRLAPAFSEINRRMKAMSSAVITRPRYFHCAAMGRSLPETKPERKSLAQFFSTHSPVATRALLLRPGYPLPLATALDELAAFGVGSFPLGHPTKRPFESRFCASQNPWPS